MRNHAVAFMVIACSMLATVPAFAANPELKVPDKVEMKHKACQELLRLAKKYGAEGVLSKEVVSGASCCTRIEFAAAVVLVTEKVAEKVIKEGDAAVDTADLALLADLKEELREEMLLVNTRTFQQRNEELGTKLHALTKEISLSGGLVGVLQSSLNNRPRNHTDAVGRGDLVFSFKIGEQTIAMIDVEATGGDGIDSHVGSFSGLNGVAGSTGDRVRFRQAWVEQSAFSDRLKVTAGKIDLTSYFDSNSVANDENSQFLARAFVNSPVLSVPSQGPGARLQARLSESITFGVGYGAGDSSASDVADHGYGIAELDYRLKLGEREGNYRIYGNIDGAAPDGTVKLAQKNAFGYGISCDQQLTDNVSVFFRYGARDREVYRTSQAWSAGGQHLGAIPARKDDLVGFAYGQVLGAGVARQEKLAELYYKVKVNDQISVTPVAQYLMDPEGDPSRGNVTVLGLRTQVSF